MKYQQSLQSQSKSVNKSYYRSWNVLGGTDPFSLLVYGLCIRVPPKWKQKCHESMYRMLSVGSIEVLANKVIKRKLRCCSGLPTCGVTTTPVRNRGNDNEDTAKKPVKDTFQAPYLHLEHFSTLHDDPIYTENSTVGSFSLPAKACIGAEKCKAVYFRLCFEKDCTRKLNTTVCTECIWCRR